MAEPLAEKTLRGQTLLITGASRGIGLAIALRAAADGANIIVLGKTAEPHPKLPGTVYTAAEEIIAAGGKAVACVADVRDEAQVAAAIERGVQEFGGIDILVNNASAIFLAGTLDTPLKRFDLMHAVNTRGTFVASQLCLPHLMKGRNPHILNLSPPLNFEAPNFAPHLAYSLAKFGMSLCVLGMAEEFREAGVAVNALWPKTVIATSAVRNLLGGEEVIRHARHPEIVADAAHAILTRDSRTTTGNFFIDEDILRAEGVTEFESYSVEPGESLISDFFV